MSQSREIASPAGIGGEAASTRTFARFAYPLLLIAGGLCLFLVNLLVWASTTIFNTDEFTSTVTGVLGQQDVQERTAEVLARQAIESGDLQGRLEGRLPEDTTFLAPIVAAQLEPLLAQVAERLLATDLVGSLEEAIIQNFHAQVVAVLEDRSAVEVQGDSIVLNLQDIERRLFDRIGIEPPQRLQELGGSADGRVILVKDASRLRQLSFLVRDRVLFSSVLLFVGLAAFAGAVFAAPGQRRGLRLVGYTVLGVGVLTLATVFVSNLAVKSIAEERTVLREMLRALEGNLRWQSVGLIVLGACVVVLADQRILSGIENLEARAEKLVRDFGPARAALVAAGVATAALLLT